MAAMALFQKLGRGKVQERTCTVKRIDSGFFGEE